MAGCAGCKPRGSVSCGTDGGQWRKIVAYLGSKGFDVPGGGFRMTSAIGCKSRHFYGDALDIFGTHGDKSPAMRSRIFDVLQPLDAAGIVDELLYTPRNGKGGAAHIGHIHVSVHPDSPLAAGMDLGNLPAKAGGGNPLNPFAIVAGIISGAGRLVFNTDIARRAGKIALGTLMVVPAAAAAARGLSGAAPVKAATGIATAVVPGGKVVKGAQLARQVTSAR